MVVRTDINGVTHVVAENLPDQEYAEQNIQAIVSRHRKLHGQDYDVVPYAPPCRTERLQNYCRSRGSVLVETL